MEQHDGIKLTIAGEEVPWWVVLDDDAQKRMIAFRDSVWKRQIHQADPRDDLQFEFMEHSWPPVVNGRLRAHIHYRAIPSGPHQRPARRYYTIEHDPTAMSVDAFWKMKKERGDIDSDDDSDNASYLDDDDPDQADMSTISNIRFLRDNITQEYWNRVNRSSGSSQPAQRSP